MKRRWRRRRREKKELGEGEGVRRRRGEGRRWINRWGKTGSRRVWETKSSSGALAAHFLRKEKRKASGPGFMPKHSPLLPPCLSLRWHGRVFWGTKAQPVLQTTPLLGRKQPFLWAGCLYGKSENVAKIFEVTQNSVYF